MAEFAFYHKDHVLEFLQTVHGANNFVQKATLQLRKSAIVLAECKVLGLISKLVTGPLWRVIENSKHVLEMNNYYELLLNYFEKQSKDSMSFVNSTEFPFDEALIVKDRYYENLVVENENIDTIACR